MNKFICSLFIFFSLAVAAQESDVPGKRIQGSRELPLELNLLVQSLQETNEPKEHVLNSVLKIDSYARLLSKEDIFLVTKIEIYKSLLKTNETRVRFNLDGDSLKILKTSLQKAKDPFVKWFLQALLKDADSLMSGSLFKEYVLQKNNGKLEKIELRKIDKKVQLLTRWIAKINPEAEDFENTLKSELAPVMSDALKNVEQSFFIMAQNTSGTKIPQIADLKDMKFFTQVEVKKTKNTTAKKEKSVEDILAPVTDENAVPEATLPEPSKEDWLNEDNAPANLKNLPKPSDDADWLQDI